MKPVLWCCVIAHPVARGDFVLRCFQGCVSQLTLSVLSSSASGGHLERDRSLAGKCAEQPGSQHRTERGSPGSRDFNYLLPAQQTDADDPPDQRGAIHQLTAQLLASSLWSVSLPFLATCASLISRLVKGFYLLQKYLWQSIEQAKLWSK